MAATTTANEKEEVEKIEEELPFGWPISDRIKYEVVKQDVWSVFSPAGGYVPKVRYPAFIHLFVGYLSASKVTSPLKVLYVRNDRIRSTSDRDS